MLVGSWQIKEILGADDEYVQRLAQAVRRAGVNLQERQTRNRKGHIRPMIAFDIDKCIKAFEGNIKKPQQRPQHIKQWRERVKQLNEIKRGME